MQQRVPEWLWSLIRQGSGVMVMLGLAVISGHVVQTAVLDRHAAQDGAARPTDVVTLSSGPEQGLRPAQAFALPRPMIAPSDCTPDLALRASPGAVVELTLKAPCDADGVVHLSHGGAEVAMRVPFGRPLRMVWPALEAEGRFVARFDDGRQVAASEPVTDLAGLRRFAINWQGAAELQLAGPPGAAKVGGEVAVPQARAGWLTTLGDGSLPQAARLQVYTYPSDRPAEVSVQIRAGAQTCGSRMQGVTLSSQAGQVLSTALSVTLPECGAGPAVMLLKNLDRDVKLAAN